METRNTYDKLPPGARFPNFRLLEPEDILVKAEKVIFMDNKPYASVVPYQTARCAMNILDETVGPMNWQDSFYEASGQLFCKIGINANFNRPEAEPKWIWKGDSGCESTFNAEKGLASDCRKRAAVAWGIGRELYSIKGDVLIELKPDEMYKPEGKSYYVCRTRFRVKRIFYNECNEVIYCEFMDCTGKVRSSWIPNPLILKGSSEPPKEKEVA